MKLRRNLIAATFFAATLSLSITSSAQTVFKAADVHPPGYPNVAAVENLGKKLEAATNGKYKLQMFPGGVLGSEKEMIEQAQTGVVDGAGNNPPTLFTANDYSTEVKFYTQTTHLIIPEIFVMSKVTWDRMSKDEQALVVKFAREAQMEQCGLWDKSVAEYSTRLKAAGIQFVSIDKKPFYDATAPVRAK